MGDNLQSSLTDLPGPVVKFTQSKNFMSMKDGLPDKLSPTRRRRRFLGVDIAIAVLDQNVMGFFPARLPGSNDEPLE